MKGETHMAYLRLSTAIERGLFHPNCRHSITAYVPGLTPKRKKNTATPELEKERQQQNYYKRMVNKWKKREAIAVTDDEKRYCRQKVKEWRAKVK